MISPQPDVKVHDDDRDDDYDDDRDDDRADDRRGLYLSFCCLLGDN